MDNDTGAGCGIVLLIILALPFLADSQRRNETFFDAESDKLDRWADDLKENLERELKSIEIQSKIDAQKRINELEQQRNHKKRSLFEAQDDIEQRKDSLIADVEARLQQRTARQEVFTVRWGVQ